MTRKTEDEDWPFLKLVAKNDDKNLIFDLIDMFNQLSTVGMFLISTVEMVVTFEDVAPAMDQLLWRPFDLRDLAIIKAVAPSLIDYSKVPKSHLEDGIILQLMGEIKNDPEVTAIEFLDARLPKRRKVLTKSSKKKVIGMQKVTEDRIKSFKNCMDSFCQQARQQNETVCERLSRLCPDIFPSGSGERHSIDDNSTVDPEDIRQEPPPNYDLIPDIKTSDFYLDQIVPNGIYIQEPRSAVYGEFILSPQIKSGIQAAFNIQELYSHQASALEAIADDKHVVVSTATSSGKSLIYQIPVVSQLEKDASSTTLFLFPTKALAQDQKRSILALLSCCEFPLKNTYVDTYDGDTPNDHDTRAKIRDSIQIMLTNPDMLHVSILPYHDTWRRFLSKLRFIIIDELHYYTGSMGVHTSYILKRLLRLCHVYGNSQVQFIACSATIGEPRRFFETFTGETNVVVINENGSPSGSKSHIVWNPSYRNILDPACGRNDILSESAKILTFCMKKHLKVICFTKSRRMCELLLRETHAILKTKGNVDAIAKVISYRGGYSASERRNIEGQLFRNEVQVIVATNALELGLDIGSLDVVVHMGFPYSSASYWQQSGRAGRRDRPAYSILVLSENPLEQTFAMKPDLLFNDTKFQEIVLPMENEEILESHLQCAAAEKPLSLDADFQFFTTLSSEEAANHPQECKDHLEHICDKYLRYDFMFRHYVPQVQYGPQPAQKVSIRGIKDEDSCQVIDIIAKEVVEEIERDRVYFTLYEGAIFLHQGQSYMVMSVDPSCSFAHVRPIEAGYITLNRALTNVDPVATHGSKRLSELCTTRNTLKPAHYRDVSVSFGSIKIETDVWGYIKMDPKTKRVLETVDRVERCPVSSSAYGLWVDIPAGAVLHVLQNNFDIEFSIHAIAHVLLSLIPIYFQGVDLASICTDCKSENAKRFRPARIQIYNIKSETGTIRRLSERIVELLTRALQILSACGCESGCSHCIYWRPCKFMNSALSKKGAIFLLKYILE